MSRKSLMARITKHPSSLDWLATVDEDDEDEDDDRPRGCLSRCGLWFLPERCLRGAFGRHRERPELERIKALREAMIKTTNALSAPFLHMSSYLVSERDSSSAAARNPVRGRVMTKSVISFAYSFGAAC